MSIQEPCKFCGGTGVNMTYRITSSCTCRFCNGTGIAKGSNEDILLAQNKMLKERINELESELESYQKSENESKIASRIRCCVVCNNTKKIKILFPSEGEIDCSFCGDMKNED